MTGAQFCPVGRLDKLLFATDRSPYSEGALQETLNFAGLCSSRLYAVSVVETNPEYETTGANFLEKEELEAMKYLNSIKEKAAQKGIVVKQFCIQVWTRQQQLLMRQEKKT